MLWDGSPLTGSPPPLQCWAPQKIFLGVGELQECSLSDNFTSESFLEIEERNLRFILYFVQNSKDFLFLSQIIFGMLLKQFETFCDILSKWNVPFWLIVLLQKIKTQINFGNLFSKFFYSTTKKANIVSETKMCTVIVRSKSRLGSTASQRNKQIQINEKKLNFFLKIGAFFLL